MKRIFWMTSDSFLEVDFPVVSQLQHEYLIDWHIVYALNRLNDYSSEDIRAKVSLENVRISERYNVYRLRDPRNLLEYFRLCLRIRGGNYDIIYFDDYGFPYLFFLVYFLLDRRKVIYAAHDVCVHFGFNAGRWIQKYLDFIFRDFNNFHFFSNSQRDLFESRFPGKNSFVAPLCLEDYGEMPLSEKLGDQIVFLFFGMVRPNKGLQLLIEAGNVLAKEYSGKFKIVIAGKCEDSNRYLAMIRAPQVFDVRLGVVPNKDIPKLFHEASYLVLPYLDVTQSGPLYIAFNYGVPVIASDLPGFSEFIVSGQNGELFRPIDSASLTSVLAECVRSGSDKAARMSTLVIKEYKKLYEPSRIASIYKTHFESYGE